MKLIEPPRRQSVSERVLSCVSSIVPNHENANVSIRASATRETVSYTHLMGGLAIFLGFLLSVLLFANITPQVRGILLGAILIVVVGAIDDVMNLNAWLKFCVQIVAAVIAVLSGVIINVVSNPLLITLSLIHI